MSDTTNVWTEQRLKELGELWAKGLSISQIGEALGVSRNAVAGKAHRIGLPKRPSPINRSSSKSNDLETEENAKNLPLRLELRQLDWSQNTCCWPTGDPRKNGFLFCNEVVVPGKPYCLAHCREAYTTSRDSN